jgi:hypothetical protein
LQKIQSLFVYNIENRDEFTVMVVFLNDNDGARMTFALLAFQYVP